MKPAVIPGPSERFIALTRQPDQEPPKRWIIERTVKRPGDVEI